MKIPFISNDKFRFSFADLSSNRYEPPPNTIVIINVNINVNPINVIIIAETGATPLFSKFFCILIAKLSINLSFIYNIIYQLSFYFAYLNYNDTKIAKLLKNTNKQKKIMKTLLMFEKKHQKELFLEMNEFTDLVGTLNPTIIITKMLTDYKFKYPRENYNKYPIVQNIEYKYVDSYPELNEKYDKLVVATDFDYVGHFSVHKILVNKLGENWREYFKEIVVINTSTFNSKTLTDINTDFKHNLSLFNKSIMYAERKYYFDYNYNLNSQVFFKEIIKKKNLSKIDIHISKYMLLTLWLIQKNSFKKETDILLFMNNYKGTGKYNKFPIGTPASISTILKNLRDLELIKDAQITKKGYEFLDSLVKQTFDPDLPMRIKSWANEENSVVFEKIDKYLYSVFSKQKNKNKAL